MSTQIGLTASVRQPWDGALELEFGFVRRHGKTARYEASFHGKPFEVYVPLFMLPEEHRGTPPKHLLMALDRSRKAVKRPGFGDEWRPLEAALGVCEFEFRELKVNSVIYRSSRDGQAFSLYVPNSVFDEEPHPKRLYLRILGASDHGSRA